MISKKRLYSIFKRRIRPLIPKSLVVWYLSRENTKLLKNGKKLVPEDELENVYVKCLNYLKENNIPVGDYLEFGVYSGSSMVCMHNALSKLNMNDVRLIGFDSFQGLPKEAKNEGWSEWDYCMSRTNTKKYLKENHVDLDKTTLIKGWFSDTLNHQTKEEHNIRESSIIMIDCDIYSSTAQVLDFIRPLIGEKCILVFDDWKSLDAKGNANGEMGQKRALGEFRKKYPHFDFKPFDSYGDNAEVFLVEKKPVKVKVRERAEVNY
jgi:O-methyltransferase